MLEIIYVVIFWVFAVIYIFFKSVKAKEFHIENDLIQQLTKFSTIVKGIPAALASMFVLIQPIDLSLFHVLLAGALLFCMAGDLGMEKGLLPGLSLFLIAQILFNLAFISQSLVIGLTIPTLIVPLIVATGMMIYIFLLVRYLESSGPELGKFKVPGIVYFVFIGLMLVSVVLLWMTSQVLEFGIVVLGGLLFIISDSIICVKEFHHVISYRELKVMSTYYGAILLLSLSVLFI
ncbi:MAG: lysoplasmalogenase [Candidatus Hodarchaeota archaeon]